MRTAGPNHKGKLRQSYGNVPTVVQKDSRGKGNYWWFPSPPATYQVMNVNGLFRSRAYW